LVAGDTVFAQDGRPTKVTHAFEPFLAEEAYLVKFDDGTEIEACGHHKWLTFSARELGQLTRLDPEWRAARRAKRPSRAAGNKSAKFAAAITARNQLRPPPVKPPPTGTVRTTREIAQTLTIRNGRKNHAVPVATPLNLPERNLPMDPYLLGCWLGDGTSAVGEITTADPEIVEEWRRGGFEVVWRALYRYGIYKLKARLRDLGVLGNKHVPPEYLRASRAQRLDLLCGLMDTDGFCCPEDGDVEFTNTNRRLAEAVYELVVSLGWRARMAEGRATLNGRDCGPKWRIKWTPSDYVFRLPRKRDKQQLAKRRTTRFRYIVSCERTEPKMMRCIAVDSPAHLFLAGRSMVPTHNSALLLGLGLTAHTKSLILRVEATNLQELKDILMGFKGPEDHWRGIGYGGMLDTEDGRRIEMSGCDGVTGAEKFRGRAHDAKLWDELPQFPESVFRFVNAWNRTTDPNQRCRVVGAGNPPTRPEEEWVIRHWGPWLDAQHENPAEPGELRWYAVIDGRDVEVESGDQFTHGTELITPRSRTFIPARLADNPELEQSGYRATLQGLPEPLRSQLLYGDMTAGRADHAWQLIPTEWVRQSMRAWRPDGRGDRRMTAAAIDVARGGEDDTALCKRYDHWVAPIQSWPGTQTPDGPALIVKVLPHLESLHMPVLVDVLATAGGGAVDSFKYALPSLRVRPINFGAGSTFKDKTGRLEMKNLRAEAYFRLREALDPASDKPRLLLPPDRDSRLMAEICAVRWKEVAGGKVQLEAKEDIKERLGRSTDWADAVAMSLLCHGAAEWLPPKQAEDDGRDRRRERSPNLGRYGSGGFMGVGY
jgi:hypothetical protein